MFTIRKFHGVAARSNPIGLLSHSRVVVFGLLLPPVYAAAYDCIAEFPTRQMANVYTLPGSYNTASNAFIYMTGTTANIATLSNFAPIPRQGLTHAYFFNGSGKDASGNGHDLWEISRKDTVDRNGKANSAVSLNGSNQAFRLPDSTLPCNGAPFTVSLWASNNSENAPTLTAWGKFEVGKFFKIAMVAGGTDIVVTNGVDTLKNRIHTPYNKYLAWFPVTVAYNGTTTDLYIGDSLVKSKNIPIAIEKGGFLGIGGQVTSTGGAIDKFKGSMDCALIYNRYMSKDEVSYLLKCSEKLNSAPVFSSKSVDSAKVGDTYSYSLNVTDPDSQTITYKLIKNPSGMALNNKVITWNPSTGGDFEVSISATDGLDTVTQNYTLHVSVPVSIYKNFVKPVSILKSNNQILYYSINGRRLIKTSGINQLMINKNGKMMILR